MYHYTEEQKCHTEEKQLGNNLTDENSEGSIALL
jgi:hypothetical protein